MEGFHGRPCLGNRSDQLGVERQGHLLPAPQALDFRSEAVQRLVEPAEPALDREPAPMLGEGPAYGADRPPDRLAEVRSGRARRGTSSLAGAVWTTARTCSTKHCTASIQATPRS